MSRSIYSVFASMTEKQRSCGLRKCDLYWVTRYQSLGTTSSFLRLIGGPKTADHEKETSSLEKVRTPKRALSGEERQIIAWKIDSGDLCAVGIPSRDTTREGDSAQAAKEKRDPSKRNGRDRTTVLGRAATKRNPLPLQLPSKIASISYFTENITSNVLTSAHCTSTQKIQRTMTSHDDRTKIWCPV